jgi:hypothetical protein
MVSSLWVRAFVCKAYFELAPSFLLEADDLERGLVCASFGCERETVSGLSPSLEAEMICRRRSSIDRLEVVWAGS